MDSPDHRRDRSERSQPYIPIAIVAALLALNIGLRIHDSSADLFFTRAQKSAPWRSLTELASDKADQRVRILVGVESWGCIWLHAMHPCRHCRPGETDGVEGNGIWPVSIWRAVCSCCSPASWRVGYGNVRSDDRVLGRSGLFATRASHANLACAFRSDAEELHSSLFRRIVRKFPLIVAGFKPMRKKGSLASRPKQDDNKRPVCEWKCSAWLHIEGVLSRFGQAARGRNTYRRYVEQGIRAGLPT
jgi:hypothetical protein